MRRGLSQGLLCGALTALLFGAPAALMAQTPPAGSAATPVAKPAAVPPAKAAAVTKPTKAVVKTAAKPIAPAHPTKVAAKPKPVAKTTAARKPAPKLAAKTPEPAKQNTAIAAAPSYTITTVRDHVTTTRVVSVTPGAKPAAAPPKPTATAVDHAAAQPPVEPTPTQTAPVQTASAPARSPAPVAAVAAASLVPATPRETAPPPAQATAPTPASMFVSAFLDKAFGIARETNITPLQRRALLADLFGAKMDVSRIAGYTTGDELTAQTADFQHRFKTILISYLVETYYPRIELAADPSVKVDITAANSLPDGTAVVWTTFTKSEWVSQSVKWHLVPEADGFKIVDIYSAGASLVQMERDTFLSVMRDGGLPQLMAKLDARTKALATAP